jgi:hypothetical protein
MFYFWLCIGYMVVLTFKSSLRCLFVSCTVSTCMLTTEQFTLKSLSCILWRGFLSDFKSVLCFLIEKELTLMTSIVSFVKEAAFQN